MKSSVPGLLLATLLLVSAPSADPIAQESLMEVAQNTAVSRDQAAAIAQSASGGRVLSVEFQNGGGGRWRVKVLLPNRRVRTLVIDANSGAVRG